MAEQKLKPYGDIMHVTGKYQKDGREKNRYAKVGTMFATPHFSRVVIKLDTAPIGGEGWLSVFPKDDAVKPIESWQQEDREVDF